MAALMTTILLVDAALGSRALNRAYLRDILGPRVPCLEASSSAAAVALLASEPITVLLLDFALPGSQEVLAAALQRDARQAPLQLMAIVADGLPQTRARVAALGAHGLLEKPVRLHTLRHALEQFGLVQDAPRPSSPKWEPPRFLFGKD